MTEERLDPDESRQTITEYTAEPKMINVTRLSHLLFINSLSAIRAPAEMKGEGRDIQTGHHLNEQRWSRHAGGARQREAWTEC